MENTRRNFALAGASVAALTVASCGTSTPVDINALIHKLGDVINQVQAAVKSACAAVPTAKSVVEILLLLAGVNPTVAMLASFANAAIDFITKACPVPVPPPAAGPLQSGMRGSVNVNGKDVVIEYY